jgi:HEAT repeat protein
MAIAAATAFVGAVTASGPVEAAEKGAGHIRASAGSAAVAEAAVQQSSEEALAAYTQARRALNYRDFQRAADLFRLARDGAPGSQLAVDAAYWEAFSLYRVGDVQAYRRALDVLEAQRHQASETGRDAEALYVRIRTELAMSGDPGAVAAITGSAGYGESAASGPATISVGGQPTPVSDALGGFPGGAPSCAPTEHTLRIAELSAQRRLRDALVLPDLRAVLFTRDECSAPLRRQAVMLAAQTEAAGVGDLLIDVARNDPDPAVRSEAVFWLSRVRGEDVARALAELLADARDPGVRERAAFALSQHASPIARSALRAVVTDEHVGLETRLQAVGWLAADAPVRDPEFLADAYLRVHHDRVRARVIEAIGAAGEPWAAEWLRARVLEPTEKPEHRRAALFRLGQTPLSVPDLLDVLAALDDPDLREYAVFVIAQRAGWQASRALLELARDAGGADLRDVAVFWLEQRRDPTARAALAELRLR